MKVKSSSDLFDYFKGKWSLRRTLEFFGECIGKAEFMQSGHILDYAEEVQINKEGFEPYATQEYIFELSNGSLHKKFKDGKMFYTLEIYNNGATGKHNCKNDTYYASYQIYDQNSFSMTYQVITEAGDKKYADIVTEFTKEVNSDASLLGTN